MRGMLRSIAPSRTVVLRSGSVIALLAAMVVALTATTVSALSPETQAWWTRTQPKAPEGLPVAGAPTVPAPPVVPNVGLYVNGSASAPSAVSALKFSLEEPGVYRLELTPAEATPAQDGYTVVAVCTVDEPGSWGPQENGPYEDAPAFSCDDGSPLSTVEDGKMVWEIPSSQYAGFFDGEIEFVLAPGAEAPFQMAFNAPGPDTLVLEEPALPDIPDPTPTTTVPPPPTTTVPPPPPTTEAPALSSSFGNSPPPPPSSPPTTASGGDVALADPSADAGGGAAVAAPVSAITDGGWTLLRTLAVALLVALAILMLIGSNPALMARLVSGRALPWQVATVPTDGPSRGIGRFARPREHLPPRLG